MFRMRERAKSQGRIQFTTYLLATPYLFMSCCSAFWKGAYLPAILYVRSVEIRSARLCLRAGEMSSAQIVRKGPQAGQITAHETTNLTFFARNTKFDDRNTASRSSEPLATSPTCSTKLHLQENPLSPHRDLNNEPNIARPNATMRPRG